MPKREEFDAEEKAKRERAKVRHQRSKAANFRASRRLRDAHPEEWMEYYLEEAEKMGFEPRVLSKDNLQGKRILEGP